MPAVRAIKIRVHYLEMDVIVLRMVKSFRVIRKMEHADEGSNMRERQEDVSAKASSETSKAEFHNRDHVRNLPMLILGRAAR